MIRQRFEKLVVKMQPIFETAVAVCTSTRTSNFEDGTSIRLRLDIPPVDIDTQ